jgi:hypothetical protein
MAMLSLLVSDSFKRLAGPALARARLPRRGAQGCFRPRAPALIYLGRSLSCRNPK